MNGLVFQYPWALAALVLVPVLAMFFRRARRKRDELLDLYTGGKQSREFIASIRERRRGEWCVLIAAVLLVIAVARPVANPRPAASPEGGRDLIFVLDVSRSMLADDVRPSRLERAKEDISRCVKRLNGERIGLVLFAGSAAIRCPLTTDQEFFLHMLRDAAPESVAYGSTYLQSALEKTTDRMLNKNRTGYEDLVLLTDGEDQGSHPEKTLAGLNAANARLLVIGYGEPKLGARIPTEGGGFLLHENREIWTRLQEANLQSLSAAATHGEYARGGTPGFDLGRTYQHWSADAPRRLLHGRGGVRYDEYFAFLLAPALLLLLYPFPPLRGRTATFLLCACFLFPGHVWATDPTNSNNTPFQEGMLRMKTSEYKEAMATFQAAADAHTISEKIAVCRFNEALAGAALADKSADPGGQVELLDAAIIAMRSARLLRPDWPVATRGLETLYVRQAAAAAALKDQQEKQGEIDKELTKLIAELQRLLAAQRGLLAEGKRLSRDPAPDKNGQQAISSLRARQAELSKQTDSARQKLASISEMSRKSCPDPAMAAEFAAQFDEPTGHLKLAHESQDEAVKRLAPPARMKPAVDAKEAAVNELEAALKALSSKPPGDGDQSEEDADGEDYAESDDPANKSIPMIGDFLSDPVNRELPKPDFSAEDILGEEQANSQTRAKNAPARVGKGEKDW